MPVSGEFTAVEHVPHEYAVTRRRRQIWRGGGGLVGAPGEDRPCFRCHQARAAGPRQSSAVLTVFIFWTVFFCSQHSMRVSPLPARVSPMQRRSPKREDDSPAGETAPPTPQAGRNSTVVPREPETVGVPHAAAKEAAPREQTSLRDGQLRVDVLLRASDGMQRVRACT